MRSFLTEHINIWTTAQELKTSNRGRSASNQSLLGIKKLRELILELAVRGKLVPQDPNDEPASELLKQIESEKRRLIKEGKIKKQEVLPEVGEDEHPFDLPKGWEWKRLGDVTTYGIMEKAEPNEVSNDTWVLDLEDIEKETSNLLQKVRYSEKQFQSSKNRFYKDDVIYGKLRPYLDKVIVADEMGVCTTEMIPLNGYGKIAPQYIRLVMKTPYFIQYASESTHGMNLPRLGTEKARLACFPLPPLAEQHRIVAKVDELMALCDELENQQTNSNVAHESLVATLLGSLTDAENSNSFDESWQRIANHFDILFATEHSIDQLKQTILQLAVMGKLVPQNPEDEPASELLKKIAKEKAQLVKEGKIKKQASLPEITEDEKPFELPERWAWARLQDVTALITDGKHGDCQNQFGSEYYFLSAKDINDGKLNYEFGREINFTEFQETHNRTNLIAGDICMVNTGATVGKLAVAADDPKTNRTTFQKSVAVIKPVRGFLESQYLKIFLLSEAKKMLTKSGGSAINNLLLGDLKIKPFALPPHSEQLRIVSKVDELFALCDGLRECLSEAQALQNQMAVAVVEQALA
jgi:type I restriction enzyme, S subunit